MHALFKTYLFVSAVIPIGILVTMLHQDLEDKMLRNRPRDRKFGYNITSFFSWVIIAFTLPGINLFTIVFLSWNWIDEWKRKQ